MDQFSSNLSWQKSHQNIELTANLDYSPRSVWLTPAISAADNTLPFYVQELGNTIAGQDYYCYRKGLESYIICYLYGGEGIVEYNGHTTRLMPGMAYWLDCVPPHAYYTAKGGKHFYALFVHFYGSSVKDFYNFFSNICSDGCISLLPDSNVPSCLHELIEIYGKGIQDMQTAFYASSLLSLLCSSMIDSACHQKKSTIPDFVTDMSAFLEENYTEHIDLEFLSKHYFLSKSYLQRQFKKYTGLSPTEYLARLRISHAKQLLRTTTYSVQQIAVMVGIPDASYFVYTFKQMVGMTPALFRKMWHFKE